ncbi:restriction endonuclease subunit S [Enterococcus faecalis]|nr:restriction endonuclease subunit S [Enterococcus faecalis]
MKKAPRIRFRGFQEDWEQRKLIDLVVRLNKSTNSSRLPKLEFEDIVAGEGRLNKDVSQKFDNRKGIEFLPNDILYGKLRPYLKNWLKATFTGVALGDFWVFRVKNSDSDFIYSLIQADRYQKAANDTSGTKMPRSDWKKVSGTVFYVPNDLKEQQKIGTLFKQIDDAITLHQRKLDQLKELKTAYLQVMFVSMKTKNNKVPKLRFADFGGEWDQRKSKELFIPKSEKNQPNLPVLSVTQDSGVVYRDQVGIDIKYDSTTLKNYKVVNKNDFVISLRSFQGGFELSDKKGITSPAYTIFVPKDIKLHDNLFWKTQFKTFQFIEALKTVTFGIRDGKSISFTEFGDLKLCFPKNKKEQQKIGKFFEELDYAISLHQNKLTQLKSLKKSYLQNMFI